MTETGSVATADLLQAVYKNLKMASDSILNVMPKIRDEALRHEMTIQLSCFDAFSSRAAKLLAQEGVTPEEGSFLSKTVAKWGSMMHTMADASPAHIAEMMVEGATMGMTDMLRQLREAENRTASEDALQLARDACAYEEKIVEDMKKYLR